MLVAEQAAEWRVRLETASPRERDAFWHWVEESPLHMREALVAEACHTLLVHFFRGRRFDADEFVGRAGIVTEIDSHDSTERTQDAPAARAISRVERLKGSLTAVGRSSWKFAAAVSFITLFAVATIAVQAIADRRVVTAPGEWETKVLSDGSIVSAGPRTKVLIEFTHDRRLVRFIRGEALFKVAKNPRRPFLVETDQAIVRAVGTSFAVSVEDKALVRVTVKEGIVAVDRQSRPRSRQSAPNDAGQTIMLKAGEQIAVTEAGPLAVEHVDVDASLAWVRGQLVFESETVEQAVSEFNRRNRTQIRVLDPAIAQRAVRGVFSATRPELFAAYLEREGGVLVDNEPGTLTIAPSPDNGGAEVQKPKRP